MVGLFPSTKGFAHGGDTEVEADSDPPLTGRTREVNELQRFPLPLNYFPLLQASLPVEPFLKSCQHVMYLMRMRLCDSRTMAAKGQLIHQVDGQPMKNQKFKDIS